MAAVAIHSDFGAQENKIYHCFHHISANYSMRYIISSDESERGEWKRKVGLKLNIQKTKIMASGPITARQIDGETMEIVTDFTLRGSKITADGDCTDEIKRHLLLGRKAMTI